MTFKTKIDTWLKSNLVFNAKGGLSGMNYDHTIYRFYYFKPPIATFLKRALELLVYSESKLSANRHITTLTDLEKGYISLKARPETIWLSNSLRRGQRFIATYIVKIDEYSKFEFKLNIIA